MRIAILTAASLLALTACSTPIPPPGETYTRCGKQICVLQKPPYCENNIAVWKFEVHRKDYLDPKGNLVYSRELTNIKGEYEGISDSEGGDTNGGGTSKSPEEARLPKDSSLTVTFQPDGLKYDLDWDTACAKVTT